MRLQVTDVRTLGDDQPVVREYEFRGSPVTLGSHSKNLVQIPDTEIAPFHAVILPVGTDRWMYQPTTTDSQTKVNGEEVHEPIELSDGDVLEITHFSITYTEDAELDLVLPEPGNVEELAKIRQFPLPPRSEVRKAESEVSLGANRQRAIGQFVLRLRRCTDFAKLLEATVEMLLPELNARTVWMGVRRDAVGSLEFVDGRSDKGRYVAEPPRFDAFEYRCLARQQFILIPKTGDAETQSVVAVPIVGVRGALGLIYADTRRRTHVFDDADLDFVTLVAGILAPHVEALVSNQLEQREQLNTGSAALLQEVQGKLDPKSVPNWPELQIAAHARPGSRRGGDVYDIMRLPNGLLAVLIGTVRAEPTRAALALAEARSAFRIAGLHADRPHILLKALNWLFHDEKDSCVLHGAVFVMNPKTGAAEFATAGGICVVVIDARGNARSLARIDVPPVGSAKNVEYTGASERVRGGDMVAFFTRGFASARSENGELLPESRVIETLCDGFGQPASAVLNDLLVDLAPFLKSGTTPDDITLLLVRKTEGAG